MGRIYDPLGILGSFIIKVKILLQLIWKLKIDWDVELPPEYYTALKLWCNDLAKLTSCDIPRNIMLNVDSKFELHIFADASNIAYGTVAYVREIFGIT